MTTNLVSGPILAPLAQIWAPKFFSRILPSLDVRHCCKLSLYATWENGKKPCFRPDFGPFDPNSSCQFFFPKIWLCQSLNVMVSYHHVQYQKKLMIQSCENLVMDRQTERQGQVDKSDFIGCYPTNVEHPKRFLGKDTSHNDHYTLAVKGWRLMVFDRWPTFIFSTALISSKWCLLFLIVSG